VFCLVANKCIYNYSTKNIIPTAIITATTVIIMEEITNILQFVRQHNMVKVQTQASENIISYPSVSEKWKS